jgi:hypothetical protein
MKVTRLQRTESCSSRAAATLVKIADVVITDARLEIGLAAEIDELLLDRPQHVVDAAAALDVHEGVFWPGFQRQRHHRTL